MKRVKRIEWISLYGVDVSHYVCSHFAEFIASMLVFIKARSFRSLTHLQLNFEDLCLLICLDFVILEFLQVVDGFLACKFEKLVLSELCVHCTE